MAHASAPKPAFRSIFTCKKASTAPFTGRTGQTSGLSFTDVRIHYSSNVVQCHNFFTDQTGGSADQLIDAIFRALHIDAQKAANLKNNHMNFNQINGVSPARTADGASVPEATVYDFILAQLEQIAQLETREDSDFSHMKTGAILNGISRMLAHKLGDMSASDKILQKITERLSDAQDDPEEAALRQKINAFAQENPIFMYLHNEVNAHDASVMLLERTAALKTEQEEDAVARERIFDLMNQQALTRIMALKDLQSQNKNVISLRTSRLYFEDPIGLYSQSFIEQTAGDDGTWSALSQRIINKLKRTFLHIDPNAQTGKYANSPTLEKARHHERKSYENPDTGPSLKPDLRNRAAQGIGNCFRAKFRAEPEQNCRAMLDRIVQRLSNAPVMISRFASDLLSRELAPQNADPQGQALEAGTPRSYITLEELINAQNKIRRFPPGQQPDLNAYTPANSVQTPGSFSYTALLPDNTGESTDRGVTYPIFRSNKNRLYAAKTQDAQPAIFGTLNLLRERRHNGLVQHGSGPGTYGDVVLVFRKNILRNCMYTLGDRMRGYTNLEAFVYNAFAPYAHENPEARDAELASETLIPGYTNFDSIDPLVKELLLLGLDETGSIQGFEDLEVQIFDTVRLSRAFISEVYFAGSVPDERKQAIQDAIANTGAATPEPNAPQPRDTQFYQYGLPVVTSGSDLILDMLYNKRSTASPRPKMDINQLIELLRADDYENTLRQNFGFHSTHRLMWRTRAENEHYQKILQWFERVRAYMASRPDQLSDQELQAFINGYFTLPEVR